MLLKVSHEIIKSVNIGLVYDDNTTKKVLVQIEDVVEISYVYNGMKKEVTGTVKRIFTEDGHAGHIGHIASCDRCKNEGCYLYIDASKENKSDLVKVDVDCIFDINVIQKADNSDCVKTPIGCTQVTSVRIVGDEFQISVDNGTTWLAVAKVTVPGIDVDESDKAMADQISGLLPGYMNSADKNTAVENLLKLFKDNKECTCNKDTESGE